MAKLSVVIITRNEEKNILRTLESVKPVADEIVIVDSMSTDGTVGLCREFGCKVYQRTFDGYGTQKQFAVNQASNDWIFSIDADEVVTEELQKEIKALIAGEAGVKHAGYLVPRSLCFMGRVLRFSGTGKEMLLRLFDRTRGKFTTVAVHEEVELQGDAGRLRGLLLHYSYRDISHHIEKLNTYTSLAAEDNRKKGKVFPRLWVPLKFPASFLSFYFFKGGILDGYPGFMWSYLAAVYATLKVAKSIEKQQDLSLQQ